MTNTEAIKILDGIEEVHGVLPEDGNEVEEALNMAIKALQEQADRNEFYNWDAPIRHKADGEYILKSEAIRVASGYCHPSNIAKELEKLPSVAIPPEHDGCKDCVYQANPQDAMPCRECKHNYMDKWKAKANKVGHWIDNLYNKDFSQCSKCGSNWEKSG